MSTVKTSKLLYNQNKELFTRFILINFTMSWKGQHSVGEYIGCPGDMYELRALNDELNQRVQDRVNETQELVMVNNFSKETNEVLFRKCLVERISDIESWRWVLEDLVKRLDESVGSLKYEHNALRVVGRRLDDEISQFSLNGGRPGALAPMSDAVEQSIFQELHFLRDQKKRFETLILDLEDHMNSLEKTKKRIKGDVSLKNKAISVEERCASITLNNCKAEHGKRKKKRGSPVSRWESRCLFLKRAGLKALSDSTVAKQQVRGARVHLSIAAQAYGARVDSALRRRLHTNKIKLQDLKWQKDEAIKDYKSLQEELETTEKNIIETMEQERLVEARRSDRFLRPGRELTKDDVDKNLKAELGRLRSFSKQLRANLQRITSLQSNLTDSLRRIDSYADDLIQVISLDEERISARGGDLSECTSKTSTPVIPRSQGPMLLGPGSSDALTYVASSDSFKAEKMAENMPFPPLIGLAVISEEEDDYPLDD